MLFRKELKYWIKTYSYTNIDHIIHIWNWQLIDVFRINSRLRTESVSLLVNRYHNSEETNESE